MNNIVFLNLKNFTASYLDLFRSCLNNGLIQRGPNDLTINEKNSQESLVQIKFLNQELNYILSLCKSSSENTVENIFLHQLLDTSSILQKNFDWTFENFSENKILPSFSFSFTTHQIFEQVIMQLSKLESLNTYYPFNFPKYFSSLNIHFFSSYLFENEKFHEERMPVTLRLLQLSFRKMQNLLQSCKISNSSTDFEKIYQFIESNINHYCDLIKDCNYSQAEISAIYNDYQSFCKKISNDLNPYVQDFSSEEPFKLEKAQKKISLQKKYSL